MVQPPFPFPPTALAPPNAALPTQVNNCDDYHACDQNGQANFLLARLIHARQLDVTNGFRPAT